MVLPDLILYLATFLLSLCGLCFVDRIAERSNKLQYLAVVAFTLIFFQNIFIPIYHVTEQDKYRPTYSGYLILSCYIFFGMNSLIVCLIMGLSVTIFTIITLILASYVNDDFLWKRVSFILIIFRCLIKLKYCLVLRRKFQFCFKCRKYSFG